MAVINTNISATVTANALTKNERVLEQTMERLSTGKRINSASDDAAGLAIASKMTSQINGLNQAGRNANDAISMIQTADGAAIEIGNMLQRMRELSVQSANGTNTSTDISNLNIEFAALADEIDRVVNATEWNGMAILDGSEGSSSNGVMSFQIGANDSQTVTVDFADFNMADGAGGVTASDATAAVYTSTIDISDYSTSDTLAVAGVTYTVTGSETDLSTIVTALNNSTATTATPYTFSASGSTLTMTADASGVIASDPTAVGNIAITNTETTPYSATDAFAVYTSVIDTSDYNTNDTLTVAGEVYTVTATEATSADLSNLVEALNLSTATTATPYTWSASGTTLTATADASGAIASDPTLAGAILDSTTKTTTGTASTFAVYTSAIDVTDFSTGDVITSNGTAYTVTGSEAQADLISALNASTTSATAAYTYSTSGSDIVMTADAVGAVAGADPTTEVAVAYTATEATAGETEVAALYTSTIDVTDYASGDVITAAGATYTVTGSETDNSALVTALNASTATSATGYTFASTGAGDLTMTQDTAASVSTAPTVAVVTADTVAEGTAGAVAVTAGSTGVFGASLGGALSSSATMDTETADIITTLDTAIAGVASQRATFGAAINRLEYTVDNLMSVSQNTTASRSRIEDADYAAETTELARAQIIAQAGTAMLSQANQQAQSVLALLK